MRLLMITRKIDKDDPQAGFIYNWVKKMGQHTDQLKVICLEKGNDSGLADNIEVFSLGKENGKNRISEFINFQKGAKRFIGQVDGVFCHQNPEYTILIWPWAKLKGKKIVTWYAHKAVTWKVRLINLMANQIVTSTELGFQLDSSKKKLIGQGIDTDLFKPVNRDRSEKLQIISVGRISPIKNYETLIAAASILKEKKVNFQIMVAGLPGLGSQREYMLDLVKQVIDKDLEDCVQFIGGVPQDRLVQLYQQSDLAVNLCPTGAPDKAGLEAMASGVPLLACNETFNDDFEQYTDQLHFKEKNAESLADKIAALASRNDLKEIGLFLREKVVKNHNLDNLIKRVVSCF